MTLFTFLTGFEKHNSLKNTLESHNNDEDLAAVSYRKGKRKLRLE